MSSGNPEGLRSTIAWLPAATKPGKDKALLNNRLSVVTCESRSKAVGRAAPGLGVRTQK